MHSNHKLVGGSKVEDHVSNAAIHDVFEMDQHSQQPANYNVPTLDDVSSSDAMKEGKWGGSKGGAGGSKVEDHMSNAAIHDVFEMDQPSQQPVNYNVPTLDDVSRKALRSG